MPWHWPVYHICLKKVFDDQNISKPYSISLTWANVSYEFGRGRIPLGRTHMSHTCIYMILIMYTHTYTHIHTYIHTYICFYSLDWLIYTIFSPLHVLVKSESVFEILIFCKSHLSNSFVLAGEWWFAQGMGYPLVN